MRVRTSALAGFCCAALLALAAWPAVAQVPPATNPASAINQPPPSADLPSTLVSGSVSSIGLSPGNVYGPWQFATLNVCGIAGANDKPGFTLVTRRDGDSAAPSSGTTAILDDYHQWSPRFFSYGQVEFSTGTIFPTRGAYVEMDPTVTRNLVIAGGYGLLEVFPGLTQRYVNVGPELYFPHGSATVRYIPLWTQYQAGASSFEGNVSLGDDGHTVTTLTVQNGVVPAYAAENPVLSSQFQDRVFAADLTFKHWVHPRFGYEVGVDFAHAVDRITGANVYDSFGATAGLIIGVGHSSTMP